MSDLLYGVAEAKRRLEDYVCGPLVERLTLSRLIADVIEAVRREVTPF